MYQLGYQRTVNFETSRENDVKFEWKNRFFHSEKKKTRCYEHSKVRYIMKFIKMSIFFSIPRVILKYRTRFIHHINSIS